MKVPTCRTRERSRSTALWTGTEQDVCSHGCASTAARTPTCGELENVDSPESLIGQERNLQVSEEANIFDNENMPLSLPQSQRPDQPKLPSGRSNSLSVTDEDHLDINCVANVLEQPRPKGAMSTNPERHLDDMSDSLVWRRSKSLGKPAGRVQHDCVSRPDQDETLEGSTLER